MSRHHRKNDPKIIAFDSPLRVDRLTPTGQGIATAPDGIKIFLWNALPGEEVSSFQLTKKKSHLLEGVALDFAKTSPERIQPRDPQFLSTTPWQILAEPAEAAAKKTLLTEIFSSLLPSGFTPNLTESNSNYFYRNKMEYALYFDKNDLKIYPAVHARGSHSKIPITSSSIERPEIFQKALEIVEGLNSRGEDARKYQSLLLRCSQKGEVSGGLFENGKPHPVFPNLKDTILGFEYSYSPNGFFQINLPTYEKVLARIKELLQPSSQVLDLYAGVGTIGLSVARDRDLTLVEVNQSAFLELENNTKLAAQTSSNPNIKPVLAKSEDALDYITPSSIVILDPPRAGCDDKLISKLLEVHPTQIIYLSCNPITQARDIAKLLPSYTLNSLEAFNFFPRTPHIESLASLS